MKKNESLKIKNDHIVMFPKFHNGKLKKMEILNDNNFKV